MFSYLSPYKIEHGLFTGKLTSHLSEYLSREEEFRENDGKSLSCVFLHIFPFSVLCRLILAKQEDLESGTGREIDFTCTARETPAYAINLSTLNCLFDRGYLTF